MSKILLKQNLFFSKDILNEIKMKLFRLDGNKMELSKSTAKKMPAPARIMKEVAEGLKRPRWRGGGGVKIKP